MAPPLTPADSAAGPQTRSRRAAPRLGLRASASIGLIAAVLCAACASQNASRAADGKAAPEAAPAISFSDPKRLERLSARLEENAGPLLDGWLKKSRSPGLAFGVVADGKLIYFRGLGAREWTSKAKVDLDTAFRIASMTKSFIGLAALQLRDQGKLSLDEPAEKYLPELKGLRYPTADSPKMTVRHLLSHAAGLPEDNPSADLRMPMTDAEFEAVLKRGLSFSAAPGTQFEYSNLAFALAGRLVQRVSGVRFQDLVTEQILKPLGMTSTVWSAAALPADRRSPGYGRKGAPTPGAGLARHDQDDEPHEEPDIADGTWAAIGGLWTTPRDYAHYVAFQLQAWPPRDGAEEGPVRRASVRESHEVQRSAHFRAGLRDGKVRVRSSGYGLGWGVAESCEIDRIITHTGGLPGYGSVVRLLPDQNVGLFAFANLTYSAPTSLTQDIEDDLRRAGLLPARPAAASAQLIAARDAVFALYEKWDAAAAAPLFDRTFTYYKPLEKLRAELAGLVARHGRCRLEDLVPENFLRGVNRLSCDRGSVEMTLTLTSEAPPLVQSLGFESWVPGDPPKPPPPGRCAQ